QPAKADQRTQQIAVEAVDSWRWRQGFSCFTARRDKASCFGLAVGEHILAGGLHALVCAIGSHLMEEHDLPDGCLIFGVIAWARLHPVSFWLLGGQDGGNRPGAHGSGARLLHLWRVLGLVE